MIIFAGAGASRGVSEEKYPMAIDFRKRLPAKVTNAPLYRRMSEHLKSTFSDVDIDVEHLLWELGRLNETLGEFTDVRRFPASLLTSGSIQEIAPANQPGPTTHSQLSVLKSACNALQDTIHERVYDFYSQEPTELELRRSWNPLLDEVLSESDRRVDVFTTNYDLVIEAALEGRRQERIHPGFRGGVLSSIDLRLWREDHDSRGLLTKLHGSVDWKLGNGGSVSDPVVRRGHPEFDGDHAKRLILYPGFKGVPDREPFIAFHDYFRQRLSHASHILFVGFAFRDEYINQLIERFVRPGARIGVVNPSELPRELAFLRDATHFRQGFGIADGSTLLTSTEIRPFSLGEFKEWIRSEN